MKYMLLYNGAVVFVKEKEFFDEQKRQSPMWDTSKWYGPIEAASIEQAREMGYGFVRAGILSNTPGN